MQFSLTKTVNLHLTNEPTTQLQINVPALHDQPNTNNSVGLNGHSFLYTKRTKISRIYATPKRAE